MPSAGELKRGAYVEVEGEPYTVTEIATQTPSARGAATLVKAKLRHLRTGQLVARTFKASERLKEPDVERRPCQLLYAEGEEVYHFMDLESFEQFHFAAEEIAAQRGYLRDGDQARALFIDGRPAGVEVPNTVVLAVAECEPAVRGDTVNNVTKVARLETGLEVQVPLFVERGDRLVIDTREGRYVRRA